MDAFSNSVGSAIVGVGGVINMALSAMGSSGAAVFLQENVWLPLLGSLAPGFTI